MCKNKYTQRNINVTNLDSYIEVITGVNRTHLNNYQNDTIIGMQEVADVLRKAAKTQQKIVIYGDYDADGIDSVIILGTLLKKIGHHNYSLRIPDRFSDGYGIQPKAIEDIPSGSILITVDNGITAFDALEAAKNKGIYIIIMDHHSQQDKIPVHNILIDPEATDFAKNSRFHGYCGAGLSYKLCETMFPDDTKFLDEMSVFATIGTVADSVPLIDENRRIVQRGLSVINNGNAPHSINRLANDLGFIGHCSAEDVAYLIAPMVNAAGRIKEHGGTITAKALTAGINAAPEAVRTLREINDLRKSMTNEMINRVTIDQRDPVNFLVIPDGHIGLLGLVAGKFMDQTGKPTFAMALQDGVYKGSARSDDETKNNVCEMLESIKDLLISYGGHPGAAGFAIDPKNVDEVHKKLSAYAVQPHRTGNFYDFEVDSRDAANVITDLESVGPFGKDFPAPIVRVRTHFDKSNRETGYWQRMGAERSSIRFVMPGDLQGVYFKRADEYVKDGSPSNVYLYGTLGWNYYNGKKQAQIKVIDYEKY